MVILRYYLLHCNEVNVDILCFLVSLLAVAEYESLHKQYTEENKYREKIENKLKQVIKIFDTESSTIIIGQIFDYFKEVFIWEWFLSRLIENGLAG